MDNFDKNDDLYNPNFSIDSDKSATEKLDMYGVWLKQKKDTVKPLDTDSSQTIGATDLKKEDDDIQFDDGFSFSDSFSDFDTDVPELDELKIENDDNLSEPVPLEDASDPDSSDDALNEDGFESLDLDDFLNDDSPSEEKAEADTFVEQEPIELDFDEEQEAPHDSASSVDDEAPAGLENFTEISLDDFEDSSSEDTVEAAESEAEFEPVEDFDDILDSTESDEQKNIGKERKEDSPLDISVTVDDETGKGQPLAEASAQVVEDNADISIFGAEDTSDSSHQAEEPAFFDDIEAVKQDLLSTPHSAEHTNGNEQEKGTMDKTTTSSKQSDAEQDKATELLMKIADEISDLKTELTNLKAGLALNSNVSGKTSEKENLPYQEEKAAEPESSGFFSDDDTDETIALTGDELNNILITADFTEEQNAEEAGGEHSEASEEYEVPPVLTKDIVPGIEESVMSDPAFEASITEPDTKKAPDAAVIPEAKGEKALAADPVFNVEPVPITSLPEDLSYLDDESEVAENGAGMIDGVEVHHNTVKEGEPVEEAETAEDETAFEDISIEAFDIPDEQEIALPPQDTLAKAEQSDPSGDTARTIHELQTDEDFTNPFDNGSDDSAVELKEEIIEQPFKAEEPAHASPSENSADETLTLDDIPELEPEEETAAPSKQQETLLQAATRKREQTVSIPLELKNEIKSVLAYMDQLLEALPEQKIEEFAKSDYFETYKHLFEELGIS